MILRCDQLARNSESRSLSSHGPTHGLGIKEAAYRQTKHRRSLSPIGTGNRGANPETVAPPHSDQRDASYAMAKKNRSPTRILRRTICTIRLCRLPGYDVGHLPGVVLEYKSRIRSLNPNWRVRIRIHTYRRRAAERQQDPHDQCSCQNHSFCAPSALIRSLCCREYRLRSAPCLLEHVGHWG